MGCGPGFAAARRKGWMVWKRWASAGTLAQHMYCLHCQLQTHLECKIKGKGLVS